MPPILERDERSADHAGAFVLPEVRPRDSPHATSVTRCGASLRSLEHRLSGERYRQYVKRLWRCAWGIWPMGRISPSGG